MGLESMELTRAMEESDDVRTDVPEASEAQLVARLRAGEPAAFEIFVRQYQDRVWGFCVRMLADEEEALDVVQEIFVSIHRAFDAFRADAKLSTWVYRVAKNHCLNRIKYLKRRGKGRTREVGDVSEGELAAASGDVARPDESLERDAAKDLVHRALAELDDEQRAVVVLRDIEGLSYDEIAAVTELAEGTVKSRLHRARERLGEILTRLESDDTIKGD